MRVAEATGELTPVQAVPAKAQANGSRYQGEMAMRYKLAATDDKVMATALHAFHGFMSNTCSSNWMWTIAGQNYQAILQMVFTKLALSNRPYAHHLS